VDKGCLLRLSPVIGVSDGESAVALASTRQKR
jgi:hypothetical protein